MANPAAAGETVEGEGVVLDVEVGVNEKLFARRSYVRQRSGGHRHMEAHAADLDDGVIVANGGDDSPQRGYQRFRPSGAAVSPVSSCKAICCV